MTTLLFFILTLFTARLTWLITEDSIPVIAAPRKWLIDKKPDGNLAYLLGCWWCSSVYVAAGAAAFAAWGLDATIGHSAPWQAFLLLWPSLSMSGVLAMLVADFLMEHGTDD